LAFVEIVAAKRRVHRLINGLMLSHAPSPTLD